MGECLLNKTRKPNTKKNTVVKESKWQSRQPSPPPRGALWSLLVLSGLMTIFLLAGCAGTPVQTFSSADLVEVGADKGVIACGEGDERVAVSYTIASITTAGRTVQVVGFSSDRPILAAAVIPFDKVLEKMPRTVSEALATCATRDSGLRLNIDSDTGDFVWVARADGSIYSLFVELAKSRFIIPDKTVGLIAHFMFRDGRLVRVDAQQIAAWSSGVRPAPEPTPAPLPTSRPAPEPRVTTERPALRADPLTVRPETPSPRPADAAPVTTSVASTPPPAPPRDVVVVDRAALEEMIRRFNESAKPSSSTVPASAPATAEKPAAVERPASDTRPATPPATVTPEPGPTTGVTTPPAPSHEAERMLESMGG